VTRPGRRTLVVVSVVIVATGMLLMSPRFAVPADQAGPPGGGDAAAAVVSPAAEPPEPTTERASSSASVEDPGPVPTARPSAPSATATPDPPGPPAVTARLKAALDARLERLRARYGMPGISASIVFPDGSVWQGTAGLADVAAARPVTDDTAFSVASVSKTFTAALILALIDDGRLSLDSTARSILPRLRINRAITVRQLLDHTSGLRDFFYGANIDHALLVRPGRVWDAARSLRYLGRPYSKPGRSWHYSNTNYLILGMLAEAVGGAPVADQLRERFFGPLGLDRTFYQAVESPLGPVARGYRFVGTGRDLPAIDLSDRSDTVPFTSVVTAAGAAGSIATDAIDLARWAQALYGGDVLSAASRAAMVADLKVTARYAPGVAYGLGVQSIVVAGHPTLGHSGRFLGARAAVRWLTDERLAIAVLTNQSRSDPNVVVKALLKLAVPNGT
jgi:CubicO group peptidase (beta-lactamase class C family)